MRWLVWLSMTVLWPTGTAGCKPQSEGTPTPNANATPSAPATASSAAPTSSQAAALNPPVDYWDDVSKVLQAYKDNEVRADAMLKGKRIRIAGTVGEIKRDITHTIYVTVGTKAGLEVPMAQCFFSDAHTDEVAALQPGAQVVVDCTCKGLMMNVLLDDCAFPTCAARICRQLAASGVALDCIPNNDTPMDEATFVVPSAGTKLGAAQGSVMCEPNDRSFATMSEGMAKAFGDLEAKHKSPVGASPIFSSPATRVIVSLVGDVPFSADVQAKTKAVVDSLASGR